MCDYCALLVVSTALVPIAWTISEFYQHRILRLALGLASMILVSATGYTVASLFERYNYNAWYGYASKDLVQTIIVNMDSGRSEPTLAALKKLDQEFSPTYENRAHYNELVARAVDEMKGAHVPPADSGSQK